MITIIISTIIELIDTTIVNVSVNTMSGNLGESLEDTAWVITGHPKLLLYRPGHFNYSKKHIKATRKDAHSGSLARPW